MRSVILWCGLCLLWLSAAANPPAASWDGLTGLFTQPTAESLAPGGVALTFSELRFTQRSRDARLRNTWFAGNVTVAPLPRWEIAVATRHEIVYFGPLDVPNFTEEYDDAFFVGHVKYVITPPAPRRVGIAAGVQDITNVTGDVDGLSLARGRRFFLVGSYAWAHLGLTHDDGGVGAFAGARWTLTENIDLIAEVVSEPVFATLTPAPSNDINFNLGLRLRPRQVPNLRIDVAAIGDGEFDFGFSLSYNFSL